MHDQMSLTCLLMFTVVIETIFQRFDVQLLLSHQLEYFKAAVSGEQLDKKFLT